MKAVDLSFSIRLDKSSSKKVTGRSRLGEPVAVIHSLIDFTRVPGNVNLLVLHSVVIWNIKGTILSGSYPLNVVPCDNRHRHSPTVAKTPSSSWFNSKMAYIANEVTAGDGCHPDAAKKVTVAIANETSPSQENYRLWALSSEALVELSDRDRQMTLDLLAQIRELPSASDIRWDYLTGFSSMRYDLNKAQVHGGRGTRNSISEHQDELRRIYEAASRAEGEVLVRDLDVLDEEWGYEVLTQICSDGPKMENLVSEVFGWLDVAVWKLREKAE